MAGVAVRACPVVLAAEGVKARAAGQPIVVAETPILMSGRLALSTIDGFALLGLGLVPTAIRSRSSSGQSRSGSPFPPALPTGFPATTVKNPEGLREYAVCGYSLPISGGVFNALAIVATSQATSLAA